MAGRVVLDVLRHLWLTLGKLNVTMAVMGGMALGFWGRFRATKDVDILVGVAAADLAKVLEGLEEAGVQALRQPPVLDLASVRIVPLQYQPPNVFWDVRVDLLLAESDFHRQALARRVPAAMEGIEQAVYTVSCEDLVILKLNANRPIDRGDCAALLQLHCEKMDFGYLCQWIDKLDLHDEWTDVWRDAFPDQPMPSVNDS